MKNNFNNNPFKILNVKPSADKKMIMRQVTTAMKNREYDPKTILESQKILFNPLTKAVSEFQYFLTYDTAAKNTTDKSTEHTRKEIKTKADYKVSIPPLLNLNHEKTTT